MGEGVLGCQHLCSHFILRLTAPYTHTHTHTICLLQSFDFFSYFGRRGVTLPQSSNSSPTSQPLVPTQCLAFLQAETFRAWESLNPHDVTDHGHLDQGWEAQMGRRLRESETGKLEVRYGAKPLLSWAVGRGPGQEA